MDPVRVVRAISTNILAYLCPDYYLRMTAQTGRGHGDNDPVRAADYFYQCFEDYIDQLSLSLDQVPAFLKGKELLEYGPGDTPGVAVLFYAYGADSIVLVDRFSMLKMDANNQAIISNLIRRLPDVQRLRARQLFISEGDVASGFKEELLTYRTNAKGLSNLSESVDLIYSRAVLEHVSDLEASFEDMSNALKLEGVAIHQVDLKSHGLHKNNPLDFLYWPDWLWKLMYSGKGVPNRWRVNKYREIIAQTTLVTAKLESIARASDDDIANAREQLTSAFREVSDQDLSCLGFWVHLYKPDISSHNLD